MPWQCGCPVQHQHGQILATIGQMGECSRGVSCHFHHSGIPVDAGRCFICGSPAHRSPECTRPGGGADPKKDEHWAEYRKRREEATAAGKLPKGKGKGTSTAKGKGKGAGKGGGKGVSRDQAATVPSNPQAPGLAPSGGTGPGNARACIDIAAAADASTSSPPRFPRDGVALDSWANVWLKHQRAMPDSYYTDTVHLAHGECRCHKHMSPKGIPIVLVPYEPKKDNIDLFPEGFLWERGCKILRDDDPLVVSPKGRTFRVQMWGNMPFLTKNELHQIIADLPEHHEPGRSGQPAQAPRTARAANAVAVDLDHMKSELSTVELGRLRAKYRNLPDLYWEDDSSAMISADRFDKMMQIIQCPSRSRIAKFWELCSGSGALSATGRTRKYNICPLSTTVMVGIPLGVQIRC